VLGGRCWLCAVSAEKLSASRYRRSVALTRRGLLLGAGAAAVLAFGAGYELVEHDVLPGRIRLNTMLG